MVKRCLLSWSTGKDSAWTLHTLRQQPDVEVVGLFTTVNEKFKRVAMHAVRLELLQKQAEAVGVPLRVIYIPYPCTNEAYESRMSEFMDQVKADNIDVIAFGDLFLEDIRKYREEKMSGTGVELMFPLWGRDTKELAQEMVASGLRAKITCIDPKKLAKDFVGREFNGEFVWSLPEGVDWCGEYGEFHSFAFTGPMFAKDLEVEVGEVVEREGFVYADLTLKGQD